jgi:UDP-2-acetamido-2,6-beta-L-arabino-hexul-4-ose reductase
MRILITGARGFIGRNLSLCLAESGQHVVAEFCRDDDERRLAGLVAEADLVVHLAGENRPSDPALFAEVNAGLTERLCDAIRAAGRPVSLILASSTQAVQANLYGQSKLAAETAVEALAAATGNPCCIYRLPGVFGKWCRPNYNSVVATFCYNIARDLPITISDRNAPIRLVYIDDVVSEFIARAGAIESGLQRAEVGPEYSLTLGELADQLVAFRDSRRTLVSERVGSGLVRALYSTYVSYLPAERFSYPLQGHEDSRGMFVEILKTQDSGQFSCFTARPGVTRGGHYHHSKTEKFLVIHGSARFCFRSMASGESHEIVTNGERPEVVETVPGWVHDVTNIGDDEMVVMLWANENFDGNRPDTIAGSV